MFYGIWSFVVSTIDVFFSFLFCFVHSMLLMAYIIGQELYLYIPVTDPIHIIIQYLDPIPWYYTSQEQKEVVHEFHYKQKARVIDQIAYRYIQELKQLLYPLHKPLFRRDPDEKTIKIGTDLIQSIEKFRNPKEFYFTYSCPNPLYKKKNVTTTTK